MDLRCKNVKHAEMTEPGIIEVKCRSRFCGAGNGVVIIHRFDTLTGELLITKRFKEPIRNEQLNGSGSCSTSLRNARH